MPSKPSLWLVVLSALLYALAFPPINLTFLVFVAIVPWLAHLKVADKRQTFWSGIVFGLLFWWTQMYWVVPFVNRWTNSIWLGFVPLLLIPVLAVWYFPLLAFLMRAAIRSSAWWAIPCAWGLIEWLRSSLPGVMFPWGLLAHPLGHYPVLIQNAAFGQEYLVSSWVALVNVLVWMMFDQAPRRNILQAATASLVMAIISVARYASPPQTTNKLVTMVQTGQDLAFGDPTITRERTREAAMLGITQAIKTGADFVVLPEDVDIRESDILPVPVIYGTIRRVNGQMRRSAVLKVGSESQFADKTRLVMFGEYVPFRDRLPFLNNFNLPNADIVPGSSPTSLNVKSTKVGPLICFEAIFPDISQSLSAQQGVQTLAILNIDDWYQGTGAIEQLALASVWRSVECGLPVVRSASLGVTQAVDARGNVLARAKFGEARALNQVLPVPTTPDGFEYRNWIWLAFLAGTATAFKRKTE